jgi:DnaK suppressor protein
MTVNRVPAKQGEEIMARKDALLKLYARLKARRSELTRLIREELRDLGHGAHGPGGGDDVDLAADTAKTEMTSQLAQIESRELVQIDRALRRLRDGTYGTCESCGKKIPVARLNALPYTTSCIECQREKEDHPNLGDQFTSGWQKVFESEASSKEVSSLNLADLEYIG